MKSTNLKSIGLILIVAGLVGVGITAVGLFEAYRSETTFTATSLAESISSTLLPASIGTVLCMSGLIMVLVNWWLARGAKRLSNQPGANIEESIIGS